MNYTVFYSWQSDLENRFNRSFIQDAIEKAIKAISKDDTFSINAVIDRDTHGLPGSPSIVESITSKIAKADIFICDISIINHTFNARSTPNPNVLYELGYASAILGWERIIMIQNTAFGGAEKLPFDLKGRRVLQYSINELSEIKAEERKQLKNALTNTFLKAFEFYIHSVVDNKEKITWWGDWQLTTKAKIHGGNLHIKRVSSDSFFFDMEIFEGSRSGYISGRAHIITPHSAYARIKSDFEEDCEITFRRHLEGNTWHMIVEPNLSCQSFHGIGTSFWGSYIHVPEPVLNWGYLDEIDLNEIERLTGKYLHIFLNNFQGMSVSEDSYAEKLVKVVRAGVKGFYGTMEAIVVLNDEGDVWCACLDSEAYVVRYFTNSNSDEPTVILEWLEHFSDRQLIINVDNAD